MKTQPIDQQPMVNCIYKDTNEAHIITMSKAIDQLSGYWKPDAIQPMLLEGNVLWTPYASYSIIIAQVQ
jgi:hypothetical protein